MSEFKEGDTIWAATVGLETGKVGLYFTHYTGDDVQVKFPEGLVGTFSPDRVYQTKNEAIDGMIKNLESMRDPIIVIKEEEMTLVGEYHPPDDVIERIYHIHD